MVGDNYMETIKTCGIGLAGYLTGLTLADVNEILQHIVLLLTMFEVIRRIFFKRKKA
jgi:hypothetical protein